MRLLIIQSNLLHPNETARELDLQIMCIFFFPVVTSMLAKQIKEAPDDMFLTRSKFMLRDRLSKMFELFIWNFAKFRFETFLPIWI
jgi:hypothetical protein